MTRMVLVLLAGCFAMLVGTVASILARDFVPSAPELSSRPPEATMLAGPSPNVEGKRDKLSVVAVLPQDMPSEIDQSLDTAALRQALGVDSPLIEAPPTVSGPVPLPRARGAARPPPQKNYSLLSEMQIAAIRTRLRLTAAQEQHWPPVEAALRAMARTMHERRQGATDDAASAEASAQELEQLQNAATPLLAALRNDQKQELRSLARLVGLEAIASRI